MLKNNINMPHTKSHNLDDGYIYTTTINEWNNTMPSKYHAERKSHPYVLFNKQRIVLTPNDALLPPRVRHNVIYANDIVDVAGSMIYAHMAAVVHNDKVYYTLAAVTAFETGVTWIRTDETPTRCQLLEWFMKDDNNKILIDGRRYGKDQIDKIDDMLWSNGHDDTLISHHLYDTMDVSTSFMSPINMTAYSTSPTRSNRLSVMPKLPRNVHLIDEVPMVADYDSNAEWEDAIRNHLAKLKNIVVQLKRWNRHINKWVDEYSQYVDRLDDEYGSTVNGSQSISIDNTMSRRSASNRTNRIRSVSPIKQVTNVSSSRSQVLSPNKSQMIPLGTTSRTVSPSRSQVNGSPSRSQVNGSPSRSVSPSRSQVNGSPSRSISPSRSVSPSRSQVNGSRTTLPTRQQVNRSVSPSRSRTVSPNRSVSPSRSRTVSPNRSVSPSRSRINTPNRSVSPSRSRTVSPVNILADSSTSPLIPEPSSSKYGDLFVSNFNPQSNSQSMQELGMSNAANINDTSGTYISTVYSSPNDNNNL